ncbi:rhodanese-like domain-containing protein [Ancylomarina longa]|uniref:Rhodanese-like domain-containing protein n=1 Tax=Ancylomarina longa TaxID=2487017 RepID=A0A434AW47_9BACT|nr:rhodanese-like domain-containing protein [Ancylomarina longa]RUT78605.1 rhodanese-like domain-containing protein [Ancylomarina longa]
MDVILLLVSIPAIGFGIYWYFIHIPNYYGYKSSDGKKLSKYLPAKKLLELCNHPNPDIWIIDVREEEYYLLGHIPTAKTFPHHLVEDWYPEIPTNKQLIIYCDLSLKSQNVILFLQQKGYTQMINWGKYKRWKFEEEVVESAVY